jgi:hypothetical protein
MIDAKQSWGSSMVMACSVIVDARSALVIRYLRLKLKFNKNKNKILQQFLLPTKSIIMKRNKNLH